MSYTLAHYPGRMPALIRDKPAPVEWQKRIQAIDEDLWIAWNRWWPGGERWCILRYAGRNGFGLHGVPILSRDKDLGEQPGDDFLKLMQAGWSFVASLDNPDGTAADSLHDRHLLDLFQKDSWRKYGREKGAAAEKLAAEKKVVAVEKENEFKKVAHEAFVEAIHDPVTARNATSAVMDGSKVEAA